MTKNFISDYLIEGPISELIITQEISNINKITDAGGIDIFLGQVRNDSIRDKQVVSIDYSAYDEMVSNRVIWMKEKITAKFDQIKHISVKHSIGEVKTGEISLMVIVASKHRKQAFEACRDLVELIKFNLPVWKKEIYSDGSYYWTEGEKQNTDY